MAVEYTLLEEHGAVVVRAHGEVTLADFLGYLAALVADPRVPVPHVTLLDATGITRLALGAEDIVAITEFTKAHAPKSVARKLALVIRGDEEAERAEQYRDLAATFREPTIAFFHRHTACLWLGIPADS